MKTVAAVLAVPALMAAAWFGAAVLRLGQIMHDANVLSRSETNSRGDAADVEVSAGGPPDRPMRVEVFLHRAWRPWRTTLMTGRASEPSVDLGWEDDDHLTVTLDLGPGGAIETSVTQTGPTTVRYVVARSEGGGRR